MPGHDDAPTRVVEAAARVRELCRGLPEITEHADGWARNFEVRRRSFCLLVPSNGTGGAPVLVIRAADDDRDAYLAIGHPFFEIPKNRWKVGVALTPTTDWDEIRELITDSYAVVAPKKLVALLDFPPREPPSEPEPYPSSTPTKTAARAVTADAAPNAASSTTRRADACTAALTPDRATTTILTSTVRPYRLDQSGSSATTFHTPVATSTP